MPKKKPKNIRGAGRTKIRNDDDYVKVGPFEVHKDFRDDWLAVCDATGCSQAELFRQTVRNLADALPDEKSNSGDERKA